MSSISHTNTIWEQLFGFSTQFPISWPEFERDFEIKKLELEKLPLSEIREKRVDFEKKYSFDRQTSKSWMEN